MFVIKYTYDLLFDSPTVIYVTTNILTLEMKEYLTDKCNIS